METLRRAPEPPARWLSQLAEDCAFLLEMHNHLEMQERVRREAEHRHIAPMALAKMIGMEWDRLGIIRAGVNFPGLN